MKWPPFWGQFGRSRIVIYADFIDPFGYIGFHNVRRAAEACGIDLEWRGFELNPDTPPGGSMLQTAANSDLRPGMWASVADFAKKSGLTLVEPAYVPNSRVAHLWVQEVREAVVKNSLIERIYQAYLSDKKDIGDPTVLTALAAEFGLSNKPVVKHVLTRDGSRLEQFRQEAIKRQFPGMPGFAYKGEKYFGALSENAWTDIIKKETLCSTR